MDVYFIRHGETLWNREKKLQGRTNIALSERGIAQIKGYQLPDRCLSIDWFASPLLRARETAELLGVNAFTELAIIEMNWGLWEGRCIADLRSEDLKGFTEIEDKGFDLLPPDGESPRMVGERVTNWIDNLSQISAAQTIGCVSHKGIIRAIYALATGWSMLGKAPHKLDFHCAQHFKYQDGVWSVVELNIKLSR